MMIPDTLSPLPVLPQSGDAAPEPEVAVDEFVSERTVRQLLVGPMTIAEPVLELAAEADEFAGRRDVAEAARTPFTNRRARPLARNTEAPAKAFVPTGPHPALAEPRHATPPQPRPVTVPVSASARSGERWWVFGMGLGLLLALGTGALYHLFTAESPAEKVTELPATPPASIAAADTAAMP